MEDQANMKKWKEKKKILSREKTGAHALKT